MAPEIRDLLLALDELLHLDFIPCANQRIVPTGDMTRRYALLVWPVGIDREGFDLGLPADRAHAGRLRVDEVLQRAAHRTSSSSSSSSSFASSSCGCVRRRREEMHVRPRGAA